MHGPTCPCPHCTAATERLFRDATTRRRGCLSFVALPFAALVVLLLMSRPTAKSAFAENFWARVDADGDCWLWTGGLDSYGYGKVHIKRTTRGAHRVAWELLVGPIPEGLQLDHLCKVRRCVNPDHLEPVSGAENNRRSASVSALNARKTHCENGHEFTPANTYVVKRGKRAGQRDCGAMDA